MRVCRMVDLCVAGSVPGHFSALLTINPRQNMKTPEQTNERSYKLAFLILTVLGGLMLVAATVFDYTHTGQTATFSGFPMGAIVCLFIASLNYAKYLSLRNSNAPPNDLPGAKSPVT